MMHLNFQPVFFIFSFGFTFGCFISWLFYKDLLNERKVEFDQKGIENGKLKTKLQEREKNLNQLKMEIDTAKSLVAKLNAQIDTMTEAEKRADYIKEVSRMQEPKGSYDPVMPPNYSKEVE